MSSLGWLASVSSAVFVLTTLVQAIIDINKCPFEFPNWQHTLIMLVFLATTIGFNTLGAMVLPMVESVSLFGHLLGFVITIIPIWVLAPKNSAAVVFTEGVNNASWSNIGTSCLISQSAVLYCVLGLFPKLADSHQC